MIDYNVSFCWILVVIFNKKKIYILLKGIDDDFYSKCPQTLLQLIKNLNIFRNINYKNDLKYDCNLNINSNLCRGISAKKLHEIKLMVPFVRNFCEKYQCKYLIDVGSGLVSVFFF